MAEAEVVEFVFEDDTRVEQSFLDDVITLLALLFGEGNLCQVVFALMRIIDCRVGRNFRRVGLVLADRVFRIFWNLRTVRTICTIRILRNTGYHRQVDALPVVLVVTLAPEALEHLLTLTDGLRVVEIPGFRGCCSRGCRRKGRGRLVGLTAPHGRLLLYGAFCFGLL